MDLIPGKKLCKRCFEVLSEDLEDKADDVNTGENTSNHDNSFIPSDDDDYDLQRS